MQLQKDISRQALQIQSTQQLVTLTRGQKGLLKIIRKCVQDQRPISWDLIIACYVQTVRSVSHSRYMGGTEYNILECYKEQNPHWTYTLRPMIRQWFKSNIGSLVIKNQLVIIPTIELEDVDQGQPPATKD